MANYIYIMAYIANKWQVVYCADSRLRQDILSIAIIDVCNKYSNYRLTTFLSNSDNEIEVERICNK